MEGWEFGLRDAQVTLAREYGFESWKALLEAVEGEEVMRWGGVQSSGILVRAFTEARKHGHRFCTGEHFALALVAPPEPTAAAEVLTELGVTYEGLGVRAKGLSRPRRGKDGGVSSTPVYQLISGMAQGIAIGMGSTDVTDEHALLAMVYGDPTGDARLVGLDVDRDEMVAALKRRGVPTPRVAPPVARTPHGPWGPMVYFPEKDLQVVHQEILKHFPPGTAAWGTNRSKWKKGYLYVTGEDEIPMAKLVRGAVKDKQSVEVVSFREGLDLEREQ
jgi:hypothetical protein